MGYLGNHLATIVMGVFSAILTGLWPIFVDFAPVLDFVFIMAVPISWFITFMCWIVQKGADSSHDYVKSLKKNHNKSSQSVRQMYTSDGKVANASTIHTEKKKLGNELDELRDSIKLKDSEIDKLKQEISNLQTMVQIESIKTEIANLKMLASKKSKRTTKKN